MKKKTSISLFPAVSLVLLVVLALYFFLYLRPARQQMALIQAQTQLYEAQAALYQPYLSDQSALEQEMADSQAKMDDLHQNGYTNDSSVSPIISEAIQRFQVTLNAITLEDPTTIGGNRALPIKLTISGPLDSTLDFISYFETNQDGSYLVYAAVTEQNGDACTTNLVMYLCSPAE